MFDGAQAIIASLRHNRPEAVGKEIRKSAAENNSHRRNLHDGVGQQLPTGYPSSKAAWKKKD
jgi:hypothetical protein